MNARSILAGWCFCFLSHMAALLFFAASFPNLARAETQFFNIYDFQLDDGTVMPELRIAYETQGKLSPAKDNGILLLHDGLEDRHAFDGLIGPGKTFDTSRYFIIVADGIGGGESSAPSDGAGQDFPRYTIGDMRAAEYALISRGLGLNRLRAVVGRSMGAAIALELAAQHPEMFRAVILAAPTARSDANFRIVVDALVSAVALDPVWDGGRYKNNPVEGLRHAGIVYFPWEVSTPYLDRLAPEEAAQEAEAMASRFAQWDANGLILRLGAWRGLDLAARAHGNLQAALGSVNMPVLILANASDRLIGVAGAQQLRPLLGHATYAEIPTQLGHAAITSLPGSAEGDFVDRAIRGFLTAPK